MGQLESIHVDIDRQHDPAVFADLEGLDGHIDHFLAIRGEEGDPARIPHRHDVAVIVPDVDRPERARLAMTMTIGSRIAEAIGRISP